MPKSQKKEICARIAGIRREICGPRGKSELAKKLGISPSTYDYYETDRVPSAEVLLKIADLAGVELRWLITGEEPSGPRLPAGHPVVRRAAALLANYPNAAPALAAFLDILSESLKFPAKPRPGDAEAVRATKAQVPAESPEQAAWIPIFGRSAAGVPQFWSDSEQAAGVTELRMLVERQARQSAREVRAGQVNAASPAEKDLETPVQIVALPRVGPDDVGEFIVAVEIKSRWPDAFAVRIDGESMAPDIGHGELVLLSASVPAEDGCPAVVQLKDQIGVTCKLYRRRAGRVHLVPINEQFVPQSFPDEQIVWALRVLARVRPE